MCAALYAGAGGVVGFNLLEALDVYCSVGWRLWRVGSVSRLRNFHCGSFSFQSASLSR